MKNLLKFKLPDAPRAYDLYVGIAFGAAFTAGLFLISPWKPYISAAPATDLSQEQVVQMGEG